MMQDGGMLVDNLAERCSDEEWKAVVRDFFHTETEPTLTEQCNDCPTCPLYDHALPGH